MKTVFYFTAEWCGPCKKTRPIAEELDSEGIAKFRFIDVDEEFEIASIFGIQSIPTFILFENEDPLRRTHGAKTKEELILFINEIQQ